VAFCGVGLIRHQPHGHGAPAVYRYDNAGHAFQSFNSEDKFRSEASEDAWAKVLDFFQEKL